MRTRVSVLAASLLGAATLFSVRSAAAQGGGARPAKADAPLIDPGPTPALGTAWSRVVSLAFDTMRSLADLRGAAAAAQAGLQVTPAVRTPALQVDLPQATRPPRHPELRFGPVEGAPLPIAPATVSDGDSRGQAGVLLGLQVHLPWMMP